MWIQKASVLKKTSIISLILLSACSSSPEWDSQDRSFMLFTNALQDMNTQKGSKTPLSPFQLNTETLDYSSSEPVILKFGLAECLELAHAHNRQVLLEKLNIELKEANLLQSQAADDIYVSGGINAERRELELQNRFIGDAREKEEQTLQNVDFILRRSFSTGTSLSLEQRLQRLASNNPFQTFQWNSSIGLQLEQNLLEGFGRSNQYFEQAIAEKELKAQHFKERHALSQISFLIAQSYWQLVFAQEDFRLLQKQKEIAKLSFDRAKRRFKQGLSDQLDVLRSESILISYQENVLQAEKELSDRSDQLLRLLYPEILYGYSLVPGFQLRIEAQNSFEKPASQRNPLKLHDQLLFALDNRADLKAAIKQFESSGIRVHQRKNALLPELNLQLNTFVYGNSTELNDVFASLEEVKSKSYGAGLSFEIPLGNSADRAGHQQAQAQWEQALLALREVETTIIIEVVEALRELERSQTSIDSLMKLKTLRKQEFEAESERWNRGISSSFEVEQALTNFTNAERNFFQGKARYEIARLNLLRSTGGSGF